MKSFSNGILRAICSRDDDVEDDDGGDDDGGDDNDDNESY